MRLPDPDGTAAAMSAAQLRGALRRLQTAYSAGVLSPALYLRLITGITKEHPPLVVLGRLWGRQQ